MNDPLMVILVPLVVLTAGIAVGLAWPRWQTVALSVAAALVYLATVLSERGGPSAYEWGEFGVFFNVLVPVLGVVGTGTGLGLAQAKNGKKVP